MQNESITWYRYRPAGLPAPLFRGLVVGVVIGLPLLLMAVGTALPGAGLLLLLMALPMMAFGAIPLAGLMITTADIGLSMDGVTIRVLDPLEVYIPWQAMQRIAVWETTPPGHVRVTALRKWPLVHTVYVPGVSVLSAAGFFLGMGRIPVFVVTPEHEEHENLLKRLNHMHHPLKRAQRKQNNLWKAPRRES